MSPDLDEFIRGDQPEADVQVSVGTGQRTLAVKRVRYQDGAVLTFDDITEQGRPAPRRLVGHCSAHRP